MSQMLAATFTQQSSPDVFSSLSSTVWFKLMEKWKLSFLKWAPLEIHHIPKIPVRLYRPTGKRHQDQRWKIMNHQSFKMASSAAAWYTGGVIQGLGWVKDFYGEVEGRATCSQAGKGLAAAPVEERPCRSPSLIGVACVCVCVRTHT